ncbi:MAG: serine--tRNA ligase [Clostridia bacterium]|nr:serine--tRNA ligase [Clostridia bacterium]
MLDIKFIKENTEYVKERLSTRGGNFAETVDEVLALDARRRELIADSEAKKAQQNAVSKKVPILKKEGKDLSATFAEMKELGAAVKALDEERGSVEVRLRERILTLPNLPHDSLPVGPDDSANVEVSRWGTPREFDFEPKAHWDLGRDLGILDPEAAAKVTGARFHFYKGLGARLERAIVNFFLDLHARQGYTEIQPPFMANRASMTGTGQLPKFEDQAFKVEGTDYFLIPTAEVPVTNMHREEILDGARLPLSYCAYSACFRAEAGSAGRDTRGLIRQHQFNKVELVKFVVPEESMKELDKLTRDAAECLELLGLPYRVVMLSTGDVGFSSAITYDLEVWMPSYGRYVEISSCSNFVDFQARRADIRFKNDAADKTRYVHTLNGSGLAAGRTTAAVLENFQNADGSVTVPEVLRPYLGVDVIEA